MDSDQMNEYLCYFDTLKTFTTIPRFTHARLIELERQFRAGDTESQVAWETEGQFHLQRIWRHYTRT